MSGEIRWRGGTTGANAYATVKTVAGTRWNTYSVAFETTVVSHWYSATVDNYAVALTETPASGYEYEGNWPTGLTAAGWYWVDVFVRAGGTPAIGDSMIGQMLGYWNGTLFMPWADQGGTAQTGDAYARLGAPAGASIAADIAAISLSAGGLTAAQAASLANIERMLADL